jgi:transposase
VSGVLKEEGLKPQKNKNESWKENRNKNLDVWKEKEE